MVGDCVRVEFDAITLEAFEIEAETDCADAEVEGSTIEVNIAASTITIADEEGNLVTLTVNADPEIERDDEPALL